MNNFSFAQTGALKKKKKFFYGVATGKRMTICPPPMVLWYCLGSGCTCALK